MSVSMRRVEIGRSSGAPAEARRMVDDLAIDATTAEAVRLAVSELVSNAAMAPVPCITALLTSSETASRTASGWTPRAST